MNVCFRPNGLTTNTTSPKSVQDFHHDDVMTKSKITLSTANSDMLKKVPPPTILPPLPHMLSAFYNPGVHSSFSSYKSASTKSTTSTGELLYSEEQNENHHHHNIQQDDNDNQVSILCLKFRKQEQSQKEPEFAHWRRLEEIAIAKAICGHQTESLNYFDRSLRLQARKLRENNNIRSDDHKDNMFQHPKLLSSLLKKGRVMYSIDRLAEASQSFEQAFQIQQAICSGIQRETETNSSTYNQQRLTIATKTRTMEQEQHLLTKIQLKLGQVQEKLKNHIGAMNNYMSALTTRVQYLKTHEHEDVAYVKFLIGRLNHKCRRYTDATAYYLESLAFYSGNSGSLYRAEMVSSTCTAEEKRRNKHQLIVHLIQQSLRDKTLAYEVTRLHWREDGNV